MGTAGKGKASEGTESMNESGRESMLWTVSRKVAVALAERRMTCETERLEERESKTELAHGK